MQEDFYISLIYKEIEQSISEEESRQLKAWLKESEDHQKTADAVRLAWNTAGDIPVAAPKVDIEEEYAKLQTKLKVKPIQKAKVKRMNPMWWVAASFLVLALGYTAYTFTQSEPELVMATLTADKQQEISLSDGTKVLLKEGTTFTYAETFGSKERKVELDGEAYFEVERDEERPFTILTPVAKVQVLGTAFNLKAAKGDDRTEVSVTEGKVSLKAKVSNKKIVMTKGQKGILYHQNNGLQKLNASDNDHLWRTGMLGYNDVPLFMVLKELEGYFDVKFSLQNAKMNQCRFTSKLALDDLDNVKTLLKSIYKFNIVRLEDGSYYLKGGICE